MEGGSPSCCAGARGSTIRTTPAPPSGTATTRPMSTPTLASVPAVSPPPAPFTVRAAGRDSSGSTRRVPDPRVQTQGSQTQGSRPAPVIGDPRWQGLPRANDRTIRTAPAHCPMAPATWVIRRAFPLLSLSIHPSPGHGERRQLVAIAASVYTQLLTTRISETPGKII